MVDDPDAENDAELVDDGELELEPVAVAIEVPVSDAVEVAEPDTLTASVGDTVADTEVIELGDPVAVGVADPNDVDDLVLDAVELMNDVSDTAAVEVAVSDTVTRLVGDTELDAELFEVDDPSAENDADPDGDGELELDAVELADKVPDTDPVKVAVPETLMKLVGEDMLVAERFELGDAVADNDADPDGDVEPALDSVGSRVGTLESSAV